MKADQHSDFVRIHFDDYTYSDYHYFWLRHNCNCKNDSGDTCRHNKTGERIIDSTQVPLDIVPTNISVDGETLSIDWERSTTENANPHKSEYEASWLRQWAYALNRVEVQPIPNDVSTLEIDFKKLQEKYPSEGGDLPLSSEGYRIYLSQIYDRITKHGAVVIRNRGLDTEAIISDLLPKDKEVIPTHFGRIEDLRTDNTTNENTDQLGYTNAGVDLHTDQPFIANPPGMQLLQSIRVADEGGENFMVDARYAAHYLSVVDPRAFEILSTIPVNFLRQQAKFQSSQVVPIIELGADTGDNYGIKQMRYSYFTYAPHTQVPFERMKDFYVAYNTFSKLVRDRQNQYYFLLNSGDCVLYDNYRMFHARTGFSGPRHVRGVYFNTQDVLDKLKTATL